MSTAIQNMINNVLGDGARSSKFECIVDFVTPELYSPDHRNIVTLTKTSQFPGKQHEVLDFKFKGRSIPVRGQTKYEQSWSCTFYLEQDHLLKKAFEDWIESLDQKHNYQKPDKNVLFAQQVNGEMGYTTDIKIYQQDFSAAFNTAEYVLKNCYPKSVSQIDISYENAAQVLEFTVEFAYTHYELNVVKTPDGSFIDQIKNKVFGEIKNVVNNIQSSIKDSIASGLKTALPVEKITQALDTNKDQTQKYASKMKDAKLN